MIHILDPALTGVVDDGRAGVFLTAAYAQLELAATSRHATVDSALASDPGAGDGVVLINPQASSAPDDAISELLARAQEQGAVILPVAMTADTRRPPDAVEDAQSFDVHDRLRRRKLQPTQLAVAAEEFARDALSRVQPTCTRARLRVFLSYRRTDAEGLCAALDAAISARHDHIFRDLLDVGTGNEAQVKIETALAVADVIIFVDTPSAGKSPWIAREIELALGRSVPIVWIRLGDDEERAPLATRPADEPNLRRPLDLDLGAIDELADEALVTAFRLASEHVRAARVAFGSIRGWARNHDAEVSVLDQRQMIYELRHPTVARIYPARPAVDILQVFGRQVDQEDRAALEEWLTKHGHGPHDRNCRAFDAALLLCPLPSAAFDAGDWSVLEHPERYLASLTGPQPGPASNLSSPTLLLLGAFSAAPDAQGEIINAVRSVCAGWMRRGGSVVFGGHPTFTPLVIETAELLLGESPGDRVHVFQSAFYVDDTVAEALARRCKVTLTPAIADKEQSLTSMRKGMVAAAAAGRAVVVAIGGRTSEGGAHTPGIDEEIKLARRRDLPVVLLGAPGGRSAELAVQVGADVDWGQLGNRLSVDQNAEFATSSDYEAAITTIWDSHISDA